MRCSAFLTGGALLLALALPAAAQTLDTAAKALTGQAVAAADADANPIVCRDEPPPTGSRIGGSHICMHESDWREQDHLTQQTVDKMHNPESIITSPAMPPTGAKGH